MRESLVVAKKASSDKSKNCGWLPKGVFSDKKTTIEPFNFSPISRKATVCLELPDDVLHKLIQKLSDVVLLRFMHVELFNNSCFISILRRQITIQYYDAITIQITIQYVKIWDLRVLGRGNQQKNWPGPSYFTHLNRFIAPAYNPVLEQFINCLSNLFFFSFTVVLSPPVLAVYGHPARW